MTGTILTTPFGAAPLRAPVVQLSARLAALRAAPEGEGANDAARVDKWKVLRALTEARAAFDLSDRAIAVLEALVGFLREREIDARRPAIVFPSNAELSLRSGGMAEQTLRRHLAALVSAGLVLRRDSPNGKRYCRRDDTGAIDEAYGFDLAPLALAAPAAFEAAEAARTLERQARAEREAITLARRDIAKIVAAAKEAGRAGGWDPLAERLAGLSARFGRSVDVATLRRRREALTRLQAECEALWLDGLVPEDEDEPEMSGNAADSERHIQNSKPESTFDRSFETKPKPRAPEEPAQEGERERLEAGERRRPPETKGGAVGLGEILSACPQFALYARDGIRDWRDAAITAGLVRAMLGISPDAWERARAAMGETSAIAAVAAMLERAEAIRSPGGYLRALTAKASAGKFSVRPMIDALRGGSSRNHAHG